MPPLPSSFPAETFNRFCSFILEREAIRIKRSRGLPHPWTDDPILGTYRFCNVRREDDRVTRWITENWREPNKKDPNLFFAMCIARFLNQPDSLEELGYPVPWNRVRFLQILRARKDKGLKNFNAAYIVSTSGASMAKELYLSDVLLEPLWRDRKNLSPKKGDTLTAYHMLIGQWRGLGSFMAAQVIADLKYVEPLKSASDWWSFAASGPGSRRGLNRLLDRDKKSPWKEDNWRMWLSRLQQEINPLCYPWSFSEPLHAQDLQNCLCEFDKYIRALSDDGRPKQKYTPRSIDR